MKLKDPETGEEIISPSYTLYSPEDITVVINFETFLSAIYEMIKPEDYETYLRCLHENISLYKVIKNSVDSPTPILDCTSRNQQANIGKIEILQKTSIEPTGHYIEDVVQRCFPKSYKIFEKARH